MTQEIVALDTGELEALQHPVTHSTVATPKNTLWVIGFLGQRTCYLNISREEAQRRYLEANEGRLDEVQEFHFTDEFEVYDIVTEE